VAIWKAEERRGTRERRAAVNLRIVDKTGGGGRREGVAWWRSKERKTFGA